MERHWTMIHAITRQESEFYKEAVSHANARGLMQLMPGPARETAGKVGLPYDYSRPTTDTNYKIMLCSDRNRVESGKSVSVRVELGGRGINKKTNKIKDQTNKT